MNKTFPKRDRSLETPARGPERIDPQHPIADRELISGTIRQDLQDFQDSNRVNPVNPVQSSQNATHPVALVDMTEPQLVAAVHGLFRLEHEYENMSGICATLNGMVLIEAKVKVGHGNYRAWLKENFPKSYHSAARYMRLAEAFGKSSSTDTFDTLTRDLTASVEALKQFQLDLSHPVVAKIANWVAGRGAYQLMLDFPGERGGHHPGKKKTPAEEHAQWLKDAGDDFVSIIGGLDTFLVSDRWQAPSITDAMRDESIELALEWIKRVGDHASRNPQPASRS